MRFRYSLSKLILLIWAGLLISSPSVHATCLGLGCTCVVSTLTTVLFGNYNPISNTPTDTNSSISVTCTALIVSVSIAYDITLSKGNSSSYSARQMVNGSNTLNYNLYSDSARSQIWGDTTGGTVKVSDSYTMIGLANTNNYTVYGRIPARQSAPAGLYNDSVTVTVTF